MTFSLISDSLQSYSITKCHALSVLMLTMHPIASPFPALSTLVPRLLAAPVMKPFSVATGFLFPSVCFATLLSPIHRFNISDLPRPFSLAISPSTSRTFSSLRNRPCYRLHRLLSHMTVSSPASMNKSRMSMHKSSNLWLLRLICIEPRTS